MVTWLAGLRRCPVYVYREMAALGPQCRCERRRWHIGAHRDPLGDTWRGRR